MNQCSKDVSSFLIDLYLQCISNENSGNFSSITHTSKSYIMLAPQFSSTHSQNPTNLISRRLRTIDDKGKAKRKRATKF